ncbi:hypothetical protein [Phaeovulum sp. W22_SRMD_FR3]|uniref:hypothetical protein n=1 Tax=Phaeovulum sp. W22_SRMD_FR3 TaxID=3240274 RepID=UPI003F9B5F02
MKVTAISAVALLGFALPAAAVEVTGGQLSFSRSQFTDYSEAAKTTLEGAVEFGFTREFAVQADLGFNALNSADETVTAMALHAIYHGDETNSYGLFIGNERVAGEDVTYYGIEYGHESGPLSFETFLARGEESGVSGTEFGLKGRYAVNDRLGLGARYETVDFESVIDVSVLGLTADYAVVPNLLVTGEVGSADLDVSGAGSASETYVKLGATYTFGAARGATFGKRGLVNLLPGF